MSAYSGPEFNQANLVLYYDALSPLCYNGSGITITNRTNSRFPGIKQGNTSFTTGSFYFDGVSGNIVVPLGTNNSNVRTYDSTTIFTANIPVVTGGQRCMVSFRGSGCGDLYIAKSSSLIFSYYNSANSQNFTNGTLTANTKTMIGVVVDGTNGLIKHYINGIWQGEAPRTGFSPAYGTGNLYLGYDAGGTNEFMVGNLHTFMHFDRVIGNVEMLQTFQALRGRYGL